MKNIILISFGARKPMTTSFYKKSLHNVHNAKYFGLVFNSITDQKHYEQMTESVRYDDIDFEKKRITKGSLSWIYSIKAKRC